MRVFLGIGGFGLLLGVVMLASVVCILASGIAPDVNDQSYHGDWKTYRSQWHVFEDIYGSHTLRFTVKYPKDWFIVSDRPGGIILANFPDIDEERLRHLKPGDMWVWIGAHTDTATHLLWREHKTNTNQIFLWRTQCWGPLSADSFVLKNDPYLAAHQQLLVEISGTLHTEETYKEKDKNRHRWPF